MSPLGEMDSVNQKGVRREIYSLWMVQYIYLVIVLKHSSNKYLTNQECL